MSAKDKPVSKPTNEKFADNYDRIFGKKVKLKDRVKLGVSPSCDCTFEDCRKECEK